MSRMRATGAAVRHDRLSGSSIDDERAKTGGGGMYFDYKRRFCQHCKKMKPKEKIKAFKNWKCADCRAKPATASVITKPATA